MAYVFKFSKTADTGTRVPRNNQAPLTLPGMLSTAGHGDQSRVAVAIVRSPSFRVRHRGKGCQVLERTQPGLPLGIGHIRTRTHDYERHGTIALFAALNYLDGKILSRTETRHTHVEWLRFLKQ